MSQVVVPDIGDFKEVEVIEILVKPGDAAGGGAEDPERPLLIKGNKK